MARAEVVEFTAEHDGGDSTSIDHVWYNRNTHRMTVRFAAKGSQPGGTYSYDDVSLSLYEDFIGAESLGQFFREVFRRPGNPWPGAKHDDRRTTFQQIDPEPSRPEPDLDAMKTVRLTSGRGQKYMLRYTYEADGETEVRAETPEQAKEMFEEYLRDKGFKARVKQIVINLS
jgi:hypothetical protein